MATGGNVESWLLPDNLWLFLAYCCLVMAIPGLFWLILAISRRFNRHIAMDPEHKATGKPYMKKPGQEEKGEKEEGSDSSASEIEPEKEKSSSGDAGNSSPVLLMNTLFKAIIFVQEMYNDSQSCIEKLHKEMPEKYGFLFGHGEENDVMVFQGSTAEGLAIYDIEEHSDPESFVGHMRWMTGYDYDIMFVKRKEVLDECSLYFNAFVAFNVLNSLKGYDPIELWKEAKFCLHNQEPFVMMRIKEKNDPLGIMVEHVGIFQPGCKVCTEGQSLHGHRNIDYHGRVFKVISPGEFLMNFVQQVHKRPPDDPNHNCDQYATWENFNRYGDLCWKCKEFNSTVIEHENATTTIFLDQVKQAGPSVKMKYYMNHQGELQDGLPLFNLPGVSLLVCDNIPALNYPRLDWGHWAELVHSAGMVVDLSKPLLLPWPYECFEFCIRSSSGWPSLRLRHRVMEAGCQLVPRALRSIGQKGPRTWMRAALKQGLEPPTYRISFSLSEKLLAKSFTQPQRRCFLLLKVLLRCIADKVNIRLNEQFEEDHDVPPHLKFKVSSFLLKHVMFWTMEEVNQEEWRMNNLHSCIIHVLNQLASFLGTSCVPHYFFGKRKNLLAGDINQETDSTDTKNLNDLCNNMLKEVEEMKANLLEPLLACVVHGKLDYQWDSGSGLAAIKLLETFAGVAKEDFSKSDVIKHHQMMIELIKDAPRMYGRGVNLELEEFLRAEMETLSADTANLKVLDEIEKEKLRNVLTENNECPSGMMQLAFLMYGQMILQGMKDMEICDKAK